MTEQKIPRLHEVIAVEPDLQGKAKRIMDETAQLFKGRQILFQESKRVYKPATTDEAERPDENSPLTTTVPDKIDYLFEAVVEYLDATLQKEHTNQLAKADIIIDDVVLATGVPATALLTLEKDIKNLRVVLESAPTLSTDNTWDKDLSFNAEGKVYRAKFPKEENRQVEIITPMVLYHATDKHPAQVDKLKDFKVVGRFTKFMWSGEISSAEKHELLKRTDKLLRAIKEARQRANQEPIVKVNYAGKLLDYIKGNTAKPVEL